jgi:hypothetical protein
MAIIRKPMKSKHFTQVPNHWSRDRRLSLKALGALTYIVGHAEDYPLTIKQMIAEFPDGKYAVDRAIKELEALGYLKRQQVRRGGKFAEFDFEIDEYPEGATGDRFSGTGKTGTGKTGDGKPATKKTTPRTPSEELQDSKNTHSLSASIAETDAAFAAAAAIPNQRRERGHVLKDQKFKSSKHRVLAKYGWRDSNADYLIGEIESRYEPYHDGWWIAADKNGTLLERVQEILDEYNADNGTTYTAEMHMTSASS